MRGLVLGLVLMSGMAEGAELFSLSEREFERCSAAVQSSFENIKEANDHRNPKFIDSHLKHAGLGHGELDGFGVTMVAHTGREPLVSFSKVLNADDPPLNGRPSAPNLLFFEKGPKLRKKNWKIIGMGYSLAFDPDDQPWITIGGVRHEFDIHEAGYHRLSDGGFTCATNSNLKKAARDRGETLDSDGREDISRDDLSSRAGTVKHGRIWTIHVWFDPRTGAPRIAQTDPWNRQGAKAKRVGSCAFFAQR